MTAPAESRVHLRGFAVMDKARHREISSAGGKRGHELGRSHKFTSEEAREAGRKGGAAPRRQKDRT